MRFLKRYFQPDQEVHKVLAGDYPFLVTGCGRSGTHFTAKFLALNGIDMGHEQTGALGAVGWLCAAPEYCRERGARFAKKAHQIRHPVSSIRSLQTMNSGSWKFVFRYMPECRHTDRLVVAARYWVHWNEMALKNAALSLRVEDFLAQPDKTTADLSGFLGLRLDMNHIAAARSFGDSRKSRRDYGHNVDVARIRDQDPEIWNCLEALSGRFGYDPAHPL